jgi:HTH-type transcriptional regulator / antitoxin MqsA
MRDDVKWPFGETMIHPETGALLTRGLRQETVTYMGLSRVINASGWWPEDGGDGVIAGSDHDAFDAALAEMKAEYAAQMRALAKELRRKTKLTQKEASQLLTGSPNSFSKYERGEALPSWPTALLMKLIVSDPKLLEKIRHG